MQRLLPWRKASGRKRSVSGSSTSASDKLREEKSAQYGSPSYEARLETHRSYMNNSKQGITTKSKLLCKALLERNHPAPEGELFDDDKFGRACRNIQSKNEAKIIQDISRLIVPSAERLAAFGETHLDILTESVNERWSNCKPLSKPAPQPDYAVGFKRQAFSEEQHAKMLPVVGDYINGDHSDFMATHYMCFPFLTDEVKCGATGLDIADRQNAHSATVSVRGIVGLFRLLGRESEVNRQILAFSISHDHRSVRIYGHYPVIEGEKTEYYRHQIHTFDFTALEGRDKWTAYFFTRNLYDTWVPDHFKRICSALDQLQPDWDDISPVAPMPASQSLGDHGSDASALDSQLSNIDGQRATPETSFTDGGAKRRKDVVDR